MLGLLRQVIAIREKAESIAKKSGSDLEISLTPEASEDETKIVEEIDASEVDLAKKFRFKSVAEKHSIRLAWERCWMDAEFHKFRSCLFPTQLELKRFRNFVVNAVMATDLADIRN